MSSLDEKIEQQTIKYDQNEEELQRLREELAERQKYYNQLQGKIKGVNRY